MTTIPNGLIGGAVVALLGVIAMILVRTEPSVASRLLGASGDGNDSSRWLGYLVTVAYGSLAGGLLVALELYVLGVLGVPPTVGEALVVSVAWSAALLVVTAAAWRIGRGSLDGPAARELVAFHLVYGLGLAAWIRLTWIT